MRVLLWGPAGKEMALTFTVMINWRVMSLDPCSLRLQENILLLLPILEVLLLLSPVSSRGNNLQQPTRSQGFQLSSRSAVTEAVTVHFQRKVG